MTTINTMQQNAASVSTAKESNTSGSVQNQKPTAANMRSSLNAQIIEASLKVSVKAGDNAGGLLFRTSLESIYESIGGFQSKIDPDYKMPSMNDANNPFATPEGTAGVILGFSLGLYERFAESHKGEDEAEVAAKFIETIRGGFEKGYGEAVDILDALSVWNGNVKSEIEQTWNLVQKGYDDWLADKLASLKPAEAQPETKPADATGETRVS